MGLFNFAQVLHVDDDEDGIIIGGLLFFFADFASFLRGAFFGRGGKMSSGW